MMHEVFKANLQYGIITMASVVPWSIPPLSAKKRDHWSRPTSLAARSFCDGLSWSSFPSHIAALLPGSTKLTAAVQVESLMRKINVPRIASLCFQCLLHEDCEMEASVEEVSDNLRTLGWLPEPHGNLRQTFWLQGAYEEAVEATLLAKVKDQVQGDYEELHWDILNEWCEASLATKIENVDLKSLLKRLYVQVRSEEIFELIADYPDSDPSVKELHSVLEQCDDPSVVTLLRRSVARVLKDRLCHAGATTMQILDVYVHAIQVLRSLDPSECLLKYCAEPVRDYLRNNREDTVRCITHSLVSGGEFLQQSELRSDAPPVDDYVTKTLESEPPSMNWQPEPSIHAERGSFLPTTATDAPDILAMLVSIYGSKDLFCVEYRNMLADKLLSSSDYATDDHVQTLELLKLRFGTNSLQNPQVMLKDILDSKRTNANIRSNKPDNFVDACMVSHIFWPELPQDRVVHHSQIQGPLDEFAAEFGQLKNPRQLIWYPQLGNVDLELEVDGVTKNFSVAPLLATLITHFADQECWTARALSDETGVPMTTVQQKLQYWIHQGILQLKGDSYQLSTGGSSNTTMVAAFDDAPITDASILARAQDAKKMDIFWSYIKGMLTNMGPLSLSTIHNNLQTFVAAGSEVSYDQTLQSLSAFMQSLDQVECGPDGLYKLVK